MFKTNFRLDKTALSTGSHDDRAFGWEYWLSKSPEERFAALEFMRQINYDYDPDTERIPRILEVVERAPR
jgi:hypothetical protein